jgi:hypothetical protein
MFYIYDCLGNKVGNLLGYRTMRGAERVANFNCFVVAAIKRAQDSNAGSGNYADWTNLLHTITKA